MGLQWVYNGYTMGIQWIYNVNTMHLQWKRITTKRRAHLQRNTPALERKRAPREAPEHKPASQHARQANRRCRAGRPASRQAKTAASREPNQCCCIVWVVVNCVFPQLRCILLCIVYSSCILFVVRALALLPPGLGTRRRWFTLYLGSLNPASRV
jgi:hypothetical protein